MHVTIPEPDERARLRALAGELGLDDPFDGERLRLVDAVCVFQDSAGACRIHASFGGASKPDTCLQFPHVWVDTEQGLRVGVDPCCFHADGWGPAAERSDEAPRRVHYEPEHSERERAILAELDRADASVSGVLGWLQDGRTGPPGRLPAGLAQRWIAALGGAGLERFLAPSIAGPALRAALGASFALAPTLRSWQSPPWPTLDADTERQVLVATAALLRLRICASALPVVDDVAGLALRGGVLLAWTDPRPGPMARGLAGWFRLMRAPQFSGALFRRS